MASLTHILLESRESGSVRAAAYGGKRLPAHARKIENRSPTAVIMRTFLRKMQKQYADRLMIGVLRLGNQ
jgi:hypothetical protein